MHFIRSQYDSVIVQAMMEFFVSHKNTNKGGEVMDSGARSFIKISLSMIITSHFFIFVY